MIALPNCATRGESGMPVRQGERGTTDREWCVGGIGEGSAESSGHQTERVGSSESRARVMGRGKRRCASQEGDENSKRCR